MQLYYSVNNKILNNGEIYLEKIEIKYRCIRMKKWRSNFY